jgi:hypothetical protein
VKHLITVEEGVVGLALYPQYEEGATGEITLPVSGHGIYGVPHIIRDRAFQSGLGGFLLPMVSGTPDADVSEDGMLAYKLTETGARVIFRTGDQWRRIPTTPASG